MSEKSEKKPATVEPKKPATVERWDPFRELDLFRGWPSFRSLAGLRDEGFPSLARWAPSMDVSESDTHYVVTVELAGAKKDDVHVEMHDGVLTIRGEKKSERDEKKEHRHYQSKNRSRFRNCLAHQH